MADFEERNVTLDTPSAASTGISIEPQLSDVTHAASALRAGLYLDLPEQIRFFGHNGFANGYSMTAEAIDQVDESGRYTGEERIRVRFEARHNELDTADGILQAGYFDALAHLEPDRATEPFQSEVILNAGDYHTLRGRLEAIQAFSFEYDDQDAATHANISRAFVQLFRGAALAKDVSSFLNETPLGDISRRQW